MSKIAFQTILMLIVSTILPNIVHADPSALPSLKSNSIILVGEMHYFTPIASYEYLFRSFVEDSRANKPCLAVEFPKTQKSFEAVLLGIQEAAEYFAALPDPRATEASRHLRMAFAFYGKIKVLALSLGLKIMPVEHVEKLNLNLSIDDRNQAIAENISDALKSGTCDRVMGIFGKVHLSLGMERTTTIQSLLKSRAFMATTINLQMTNESTLPEEYKGFSRSGLEVPSTFKWIPSTSLSAPVLVLPNLPIEGSTWQQFDYTLLIPFSLAPIHYTF